MKLKLVKLASSKCQTLLQIAVKNNDNDNKPSAIRTYLMHSDPIDDFVLKDGQYNKNCLYCKQEKEIEPNVYASTTKVYYNMYDAKTAHYKSALYSKPKSQRNGTTYDYINIVNHRLSSDFSDITSLDNIVYALEPLTKYGKIKFNSNVDIQGYLSSSEYTGKFKYLQLKSDELTTMTYNFNGLKTLLQSNNSTGFIPAKYMKNKNTNVQYNILYEMNGNIYNDYDSGNIVANTYITKNNYDCCYSMKHNNACFLQYAREYDSVNSNTNILYLKYHDNIMYLGTTSNTTKLVKSKTGQYGFKFPSIEVVKKINRIETVDSLKTNLYSINILTDFLKNVRNTVIKERIKAEIQKYVRTMVEAVLPAHVLLYSINIG